MNRSSLPLGLSVLKKWYEEKGCLKCTLPYQRHQGMWSSLTKSMLVWSILADSYIPPVVLLKDANGVDDKGKQQFVYEICDGLQRLSSLFDFMNDNYKLHASTPEVEVDGVVYDLSGLLFSELSEECKDRISGYRFSVQCIENYSSEEAEMLFFNINSCVALSATQKSKPNLGEEICTFIREQLEKPFFSQGINLSANQAIKEDDFGLMLASIMLLDEEYTGYKSISMGECLKYSVVLRHSFSDDKKLEVKEVVEYLSEVFTEKTKYLRKNNVPPVIVLAKQALAVNIEAGSFKTFLDEFFAKEPEEYKEFSGSGNVKLINISGRMSVLKREYLKYFSLADQTDDEQLSNDGVADESSANDYDNIQQEATENSEVTGDSSSLAEESHNDGSLSDTTEESGVSSVGED